MKNLIITILLMCAVMTGVASAADYNVYDGDSIQSVINNASAGDVIYVNEGVYNQNIVINESISLIGDNATIHGVSSSDHVIYVVIGNVNISGLTITGVYNGDKAGIYLYEANNTNIFDNDISIGYENYHNIRLMDSYNVTIINNDLSDGSYGIRADHSNDNVIRGNTISENRYRGIYLCYNSSNNIIADNMIVDNNYRGISLYQYCDNNTIINNTINSNGGSSGAGIYMSYLCHNTAIIDNTIQYNMKIAIHIRDGCANTEIINNNISYNDGNGNGNTIYVYCSTMSMCNNTTIRDNIIEYNHDIWNAVIYIYKADNNSIINNTVTNHDGPQGVISTCISNDNIISDNNVEFNSNITYGGITVYSGADNTITRNIVVNNTKSIHILYGGDNLIYNNYFGNNATVFGSSAICTWNVTNTTGPNIIGGPFIGGNYHANYNGTDINGDGFGGFPYFIPNNLGSHNYDWLPLVEWAGEPNENTVYLSEQVTYIPEYGYGWADIRLDGEDPIDSWSSKVSFDNTSINITGVSFTGSLTPDYGAWGHHGDHVYIAGVSMDSQTGDGILLARLTFKCICDSCVSELGFIDDETRILTGADLVEYPATWENGSVGCIQCGDVNCDQSITPADSGKVFNRYLDSEYLLLFPCLADVNCDQSITPADSGKVFNRYLDSNYELSCCCE